MSRLQKVIFPAILLAFFTVIFIRSLSLPAISRQLPECISLLAMVLLILQIWEDIRGTVQVKGIATEEPGKTSKFWKNKSFQTGVATVGYVLAINYLGYVVSTFLFASIVMWLLGMRGRKKYVLSMGVALCSWLLFDQVFKVNIPHGFLF